MDASHTWNKSIYLREFVDLNKNGKNYNALEDYMRRYHHLVLQKTCLSKTKRKKSYMMKDCFCKESEMRQKIYAIYIPGKRLVWEYFRISVKTIRQETQQNVKHKTWAIISFYK